MIFPAPPPATLRLRIDRAALAANWRALDLLSGSGKAGAAVKADAYGLGIDNVVPTLLEAGARHFFVAHWGEVPALLEHAAPHMVAVLHGPSTAEHAAFARATGVKPVINSLAQAALWTAGGGGTCHLMVDTGINRLGVSPAELGDPVLAALQVDVLLSHLASADEDSAQNMRQLALFCDAANAIPARRLSLANSAGIRLGPDFHLDLTRPGLSLYGGVPHADLAPHIAQVAFPEAAVLQVRDLAAGDSVGYNATWTAGRPTRVATVSIGYADGFLRSRGPGGVLEYQGRALPILGRVSMDMIVVDISGTSIVEGDFLTVPFDLPAVAAQSGLSQYELLTTLGNRFDKA